MIDAADRTARMLALVLERSPRTVAEMIAASEASKADVRFALEALERHGLIEWDSGRTAVRPGPRELPFARSGEHAAISRRWPSRPCAGWPRRAARPSP